MTTKPQKPRPRGGYYGSGRKAVKHRNGKYESHGMSRTPIYKTWSNMMQRCLNDNNSHADCYGARGITVCERWRSFPNFFADMGFAPPGMTLDRINNNGNYEPGNCRWATRMEQSSNLRKNVFITHDSQTLTISEWSRIKGIHPPTLFQRIRRGISAPQCFEKGRVELNPRKRRASHLTK